MRGFDFIQSVHSVGTIREVERFNDVFFWAFVGLAFALMALTRIARPGYVWQLFQLNLANRSVLRRGTHGFKYDRLAASLLTVVCFLNVSIILSAALFERPTLETILLLPAVFALAGVKHFFIWLTSLLTGTRAGTYQHACYHLIYYQTGAVVLLPLTVLTHSLPSYIQPFFVQGCLWVIAVLILIREVQSLIASLRLGVGLLYIILYFCTLELLPFAFIARACADNF